jgi:hypothetical protein
MLVNKIEIKNSTIAFMSALSLSCGSLALAQTQDEPQLNEELSAYLSPEETDAIRAVLAMPPEEREPFLAAHNTALRLVGGAVAEKIVEKVGEKIVEKTREITGHYEKVRDIGRENYAEKRTGAVTQKYAHDSNVSFDLENDSGR